MLCGLILIDKPVDVTSHAVVSKVKKILKVSKAGHIGTLDPFASGLLPVLVGGATRLSDELMEGKKAYLFTIQFGYETDTLDKTGQTVSTKEVPLLTKTEIENVLSEFRGEITQVPPAYSALKMNGRPLYEYMRSCGSLPQDISSKTRTVFIEQLDFVHFDQSLNQLELRVLCGKGTYVRSLARDISYKLGTVGTCAQLRREQVFPWNVEKAFKFKFDSEELNFENLSSCLIEPTNLCANVSVIDLDESFFKGLSSGNAFFIGQEKLNFELNHELPGQKCFARCSHSSEQIMFFCDVQLIDSISQTVKISPKKKIV